ncbi:MAG: sugar transferase [Actinomycetota bacterium]
MASDRPAGRSTNFAVATQVQTARGVGTRVPAPAAPATPRSHPVESAQTSRSYRIAKRSLDLLGGLILLVLTLPIQLVIGLAIALDSRGSVLFRQVRLGEGGKPFRFFKFRTMYADARERFPELYAYRYSDEEIRQMYFKLPGDPRLTRVGRHLRRTSLDELPNLVNVILGQMSLVGPRPEIPEMYGYYRAEQLPKFSVKPGLTGMAQVGGRNILRFQETIERDLEYVRRRSFLVDLWILVRTPLVVFQMLGAL